MINEQIYHMQKQLIKDMPISLRPYEKFMIYGSSALSDAELLSIIIRNGVGGQNAIALAQSVLNTNHEGILNLSLRTVEELQKIPGIGKVKAIQLKSIAELSMRLISTKRKKLVSLYNAQSIAEYYMEQLRHKQKEHAILCMFDSSANLIGDKLISIGTVNSSLVSPREIFLTALESHAVYIVLLHNHPSGLCKPSSEDISITLSLVKCGHLLDIEFADHIIIGDNIYYSFREQGVITSSK